ncbi:MAG: hypothetical protein MUO85_00090, partial [candidate division Zixibacteria bacterium]|nr:hypothetical protein [candidate division Zixibacteria bacterium]
MQEISIPFEISTEVNPETIRSWRGLIEAEIRGVTQNLELIRQLESKLPDIPPYREKIKEKTLELKQSKELFVQAERDYSEKKKKLDQSVEKNKKMLREEKDLSLKRENLKWFGKTKVEYEQLKERIEKNNKVYQNIQAQLLEVMPKIRKMESENKGAGETLGKIISDIEVLERDLKRIQDCKESVNDWVTTVSRHKELEVNIYNIEQQIGIVKNQLIGKKGE